jgi:hypothetical protein
VTEYKVGDELVFLQGGYMVRIIAKKNFGFGGAQYRVKRLDINKVLHKWVNNKKLNRLCSNSKAAQLLYNKKVTKELKNETND